LTSLIHKNKDVCVDIKIQIVIYMPFRIPMTIRFVSLIMH